MERLGEVPGFARGGGGTRGTGREWRGRPGHRWIVGLDVGRGGTAPAVAAAGAAIAPKPKKLSYKDQRDFETLPAKIEALEAEKAALEAQAGEPAFYSGSQDAVRPTLARLEKIGGEIDAAYERWAALEAMRAG